MRAAIFHELGKPLRVETVDKPQAGPGEIVLKVHYCGICGSDLHSTHPGVFVVPNGTILGHEFAGEIVESGAPGWKVGEMATALPNNACEDCRKLGLGECKDNLGIMCPKNTLTGFNPSAQGAYAEFVKFGAKEALRLPTAVKSREGAAVEPQRYACRLCLTHDGAPAAEPSAQGAARRLKERVTDPARTGGACTRSCSATSASSRAPRGEAPGALE